MSDPCAWSEAVTEESSSTPTSLDAELMRAFSPRLWLIWDWIGPYHIQPAKRWMDGLFLGASHHLDVVLHRQLWLKLTEMQDTEKA